MAPRVPPVPPDQRDPDTAALLDTLRRPDGSELNIFATLAHHPRLLKRWSAFGGTLLYRGELDGREREILILRTGWRCQAHYEWTQHVAIGRDAGLTDDEIEALKEDVPSLPEGDLLLVRAADELHESARIGDETWRELAARYSPAQLIELCMVVGQYHLVAFTLNSLGVELES